MSLPGQRVTAKKPPQEHELMIRQASAIGSLLLSALIFATGCGPSRPFYFFEDGDLSHYVGVATDIEYPDVETCSLAEVDGALPPLTLENAEVNEMWDLSLEEAVRITLTNSRVMRELRGTVQTAPQVLLGGPQTARTVYEPALQETDPIRGPAAALSAFDATWSTRVFWERNERPVNVGGLFATAFLAPALEQDLGNFQSTLQKTTAGGSTFSVQNNTTYDYNNNPSNLFPSAWNTDMNVQFRQPLLQGRGVEFNRINGPNAQAGGFFNNGIVIARINTDINIAEFEKGVRNLVSDVEIAYWELYFAYRNLDAITAGRDSALQTWRRIKALADVGARGGEADKEAQAREQYFLFRSQVEIALTQLYAVESRLRYIMGLAATDGRLIRPADEPTTARVLFDWYAIHSEGLARNTELRQQKWRIKQADLQTIAARNFLLPRLDAVGRYRWVGFGDDLIDPNSNRPPFDNAFQTLTGGDFQEWQLGLEMNVPIGFRRELANLRNNQLRLARERAVLQDQELELSHQLADAIREMDRHYILAQTQYNRRVASQVGVTAIESAYDAGTVTLDVLLDFQRRLADAESAYYRSLVDYNLAIKNVHFWKGSLLDYNGVFLAEGPWPGKAYFDARKRARERDAGFLLNYGFTRPQVVSRGPVLQNVHGMPGEYHLDESDGMPTGVPAEEVPVPQPAPQGEGWESDEPSVPDSSVRNPNEPYLPGPPGGARSADGEPFHWGGLGLRSPSPADRSDDANARLVNHQQRYPASADETSAPYTSAAIDRSVAKRPGP
jgi:outer membrane protein TolC